MKFFNKFKKYQMIRFSAVLIAAGLILAVIAGFMFTRPDGNFETINAVITSIDEDTIGEDIIYTVMVEYEVKGQKYTAELGAYQSGWKVGSEIECEYNLDNPSEIRTGNGKLMSAVICVIGTVAAVFGAVQLVKAIKTPSSQLSQYDKVKEIQIDKKKAEEIRSSNETSEDFVFHFTGKLNQSYIMKDSFDTPVYEAVCDKVTALKDTKFEFKNHLTGASETKMIGHTVTNSFGTGSFSTAVKSEFKIDGTSCWDVLASMGYGFDFSLKGIKAHYEVRHEGVNIGYAELAGTGVMNEKYENNPLGKIPTNGIFKVRCPRSEVEAMFLICFCITKTDFTVN